MKSIVETMSKKVNPDWLKNQTRGGRTFSYIPIDKVIRTLNENFKDKWDSEIVEMHSIPGNLVGFVVVLRLTIWDENGKATIRYGVGSDIHNPGRNGNNQLDPDKIIKTAYANAVKKASNMFGLGLELWDEDNAIDSDGAEHQEVADGQPAASEPQMTSAPEPTQEKAPAPPPVNSQPNGSLSEKSREKISVLLKDTGLMRDELTEYLKTICPDSKGNPAWLTMGDEYKNVDDFVKKVRDDCQKSTKATTA